MKKPLSDAINALGSLRKQLRDRQQEIAKDQRNVELLDQAICRAVIAEGVKMFASFRCGGQLYQVHGGDGRAQTLAFIGPDVELNYATIDVTPGPLEVFMGAFPEKSAGS